jgi:pyruvate dehydrogenase E1 component alpha subunit
MLETILRICEFESEVEVRFADNEMPGFVHLYHGQEAIAGSVCEAIDERDYIASTHRGHGHCLAKGMDPDRMMAELYGKADGYSKGRGGSMHIADSETGVLDTNGIVSPQRRCYPRPTRPTMVGRANSRG